MADEPDNLTLQILREIRTGQDRLRETMAEVVVRLGRVEQSVAGAHVILAEHSVRFDRLEVRLDRIETRLGLVEA